MPAEPAPSSSSAAAVAAAATTTPTTATTTATTITTAASTAASTGSTTNTTTNKKVLPVLRHTGSLSSLSNGSFNNNCIDMMNITTTTTETATTTTDEIDLLFLPPGRIGARGLSGGSHAGVGSRSPARSRSPCVVRGGGTTSTMGLDGSLSSIEDYDSDILTDRAGISDDLSESQRHIMLLMKQQLNRESRTIGGGDLVPQLNSSSSQLPIVLERMTDESLEDIHAFSDITCPAGTTSLSGSNSARVSVCSSSNYPGDALLLEPLEEGVDEEEGDGNDEEVAVTITNLENLNFLQDKIVEEDDEGCDDYEEGHHNNDDDDDDDAASSQAVAKCSFPRQEQLGDDDDDNDDQPCGNDNDVAKAATAASSSS